MAASSSFFRSLESSTTGWAVEIPNSGKKTSLDLLLQMGFSKQRAAKAIVSTGDKGIHIATEWLLSHVNDPLLDSMCHREYIVYLVPTGILQQQLDQFWTDSIKECGWNEARNYFPHMTMTNFFEVTDDKVCDLIKAMEVTATKMFKNSPAKIKLDFFNSENFIGLFVNEESVPFAKTLANILTEEAKKLDIQISPYNKEHHVSLAYKFSHGQQEDVEKLTTMAKLIELNSSVEWNLRLYSRDKRSKNSLTYKVKRTHASRCPEELDLVMNDYLFIPDNATPMGDWRIGTSWLTGVTGKFPLPYTQQAPFTDTYILHKSILICSEKSVTPLYAQVNKNGITSNQPRTVYVLRHGERVDFTFNKWMDWSFDHHGNYIRKNLNLPKTLPKRHGGPMNFYRDCPLTELGKFQAFNTGEFMMTSGIQIDSVYSSPSLRCIETASKFIEGYGKTMSISVEPGLFEWLHWYKPSLPVFLTNDELIDNGFNINNSYTPVWSASKYNMEENIDRYYQRCHQTTKLILNRYHQNSGNVLLVAHAASLDVCTRLLVDKSPRSLNDFYSLIRSIPYCAMAKITEKESTQWKLEQPTSPCFQCSNNSLYDWKVIYA